MPKHYRPAGKKKEGNAAKYITRSQAVKHLQVNLPVFRKLSILKGIFPREPKKKVKGNHHTYYHVKDIAFLQHEPLLEIFRDIRAYEKKIKKAESKKNPDLANRLRTRTPSYKLDRIIRERYPKFVDALRDLDDCLTMVHLFAALPALDREKIAVKRIHNCRRLSHEWQAYISRTHKLRKVFISVKGIYYQAEVEGQKITWLTPHALQQVFPGDDVDFNVMLTFVEVYETLLAFINYHIYHSINVKYPPILDPRLEALASDLYALSRYFDANTKRSVVDPEASSISGPEQVETQQKGIQPDESELRLAQLQHQLPSNEPGALMRLVEDVAGEDEEDDDTRECKKLFRNLKFFLSREAPRESLLFIIPAFGGIVSWEGEGAPYKEADSTIVVCLRLVLVMEQEEQQQRQRQQQGKEEEPKNQTTLSEKPTLGRAKATPKRFVKSQIPDSILNDPALNAAIALLPSNYNFEVHKCVWRTLSTNAKRVALQLPEGLLMYSLVLSDILTSFASVSHCFILGDVTYGACCVDDLSASALGADLLIHYGHSCLIPIDCTSIPCLYVFVDIVIDTHRLLQTLTLNLPTTKALVLAGTIQFGSAIRSIKPELENHGFRVSIPQSKPLSAGEVLGCTAPRIRTDGEEESVIVFVADGRFHLEAMMIANPGVTAFRYDPYMGKLFSEEYDHEGMKEARKSAILRARREAKSWGIVLGTLGRQGNPRILERLERRMEENGFDYTVVLMSEISPQRMALFGDSVDAWIQIACPRLSIDWGEAFQKPLLTPFEAEIALGFVPGWWEKSMAAGTGCCDKESCCGCGNGDYPMDYYAQDGGDWNSSYVKKNKSSRPVRRNLVSSHVAVS